MNALCIIVILLPYIENAMLFGSSLLSCYAHFCNVELFMNHGENLQKEYYIGSMGITGLSLLLLFCGEDLAIFIVITALLTSLYGLIVSFMFLDNRQKTK
jgi:hypothetical protein